MDKPETRRLREIIKTIVRKLGLLEKGEAVCAGLSLTQCHIITEIGSKGEMSVNELAELLELDKSTISRSLDQMQNSGLILRQTSGTDRRYVNLELTAKGRELFEGTNRSMEAYYSEIIASLPMGKKAGVIESLELLAAALPGKCSCKTAESTSNNVIRRATEDDEQDILELMAACGLPTTNITNSLSDFYVLEDNKVIGTLGVLYEDYKALLRSFAVQPENRNKGMGEQLVQRVLKELKNKQCREVYLITDTAFEYFYRLGFSEISRDAMPHKLLSVSGLDQVCPCSSRCMRYVFIYK